MKEQYGRLIMVTDTIPTLRTLSRLHRLEFTLELKRSMPAPKFVVCSSKKEIRSGAIRDKKMWHRQQKYVSLSHTLCPISFFFCVLHPLSATISSLPILSLFNYIVHSPLYVRTVHKSLTSQLRVPPGIWVVSRHLLSRPFQPRVLFKAMCFISLTIHR